MRIKHPAVHHRQQGESFKGHKQGQGQKQYFWIWAESNESGRVIIYGCKNSYEEAQRFTNKLNNATCHITPLSTKDESSASQRIRAIILEESGDIDNSFKRFSHKKTE